MIASLDGLLVRSLFTEAYDCAQEEGSEFSSICDSMQQAGDIYAGRSDLRPGMHPCPLPSTPSPSLLLTNVDESAVVLDALHGTARGLLLLLLLGDLGGLAAHLAGTCEGSVYLACMQRDQQVQLGSIPLSSLRPNGLEMTQHNGLH